MAISERKKKILAAVVDEYIRTAEPVGSKHLAENAGLGCSSATIRNELAELVALGYLEQPHTSAGRVPTPMGYRMYVNELMQKLYSSPLVPDPQLLFAAVGDADVDDAPLQVTQFESDIRIAEQLLDLWLEGGGGDLPEDYELVWYFAANVLYMLNFIIYPNASSAVALLAIL